jgi:hypothetical protein
MNSIREPTNINAAETALSKLIIRDLTGLRTFVRDWLLDPDHSDSAIAGFLQGEEADDEEAFSIILNNTVCRALAYFDFALQTGEAELVETARQLLSTSQQIAADAGAVPLWWIIRLCRNFIDDLWQHSLHSKLPISPPNGGRNHMQPFAKNSSRYCIVGKYRKWSFGHRKLRRPSVRRTLQTI